MKKHWIVKPLKDMSDIEIRPMTWWEIIRQSIKKLSIPKEEYPLAIVALMYALVAIVLIIETL